MKIRNDGDSDRCVLGVHLAAGATVELPAGMPADKVQYFVRNFTVAEDAPEPVAVQPEPVAETPETKPIETPEPKTKPTRRRKWSD